jgi:DNA invertase Pin-like site-specific DNA recombinase
MNVVAYNRVSSETQDNHRQKANLEAIAREKGWQLKRTFAEKISGTTKADSRTEFKNLLAYAKENEIKIVLVSEISRLGRRVLDVLTTIDQLHSNGIALYVQQFNMVSIENGRENPIVKMLIQMLAMGAEMENNLRKERQIQGIQIAKLNGRYKGRKPESLSTPEKMLTKYNDVVDLLKSSKLSLNRISAITGRSVNTVSKVKQLI